MIRFDNLENNMAKLDPFAKHKLPAQESKPAPPTGNVEEVKSAIPPSPTSTPVASPSGAISNSTLLILNGMYNLTIDINEDGSTKAISLRKVGG